eukprot:COSAG01_NODE_5944_length_3940_cov_25.762822_2_plen_282_part_00
MPPPARPELFVASEFFQREPLRLAQRQMWRERDAYARLFTLPPDGRSADDIRAGAELIAGAPWFRACFERLRSKATSGDAHAADLARAVRIVTYENGRLVEGEGGEGQGGTVAQGETAQRGETAAAAAATTTRLCTKGQPVGAFYVVVSGSVRATGDPLRADADLIEGQWCGAEAMMHRPGTGGGSPALATCNAYLEVSELEPEPEPGLAAVAEASSGVVGTGDEEGGGPTHTAVVTLLRLSRADHEGVQRRQQQREHRMYADVLARLPMLKHYSCAARTE